MVPEDTYKETRILAIRRGMDIGSLVDEALREKIVRDYQQMGLQPPFPQTQPQPQRPSLDNEPVIHSSRYEAAKTRTKSHIPSTEETPKEVDELLEEIDNDYRLYIPGLEFPTDKKRLMKIIREVHDKFNKKFNRVPLTMETALFLIEKLKPDKEYRNLATMKHDLDILVNDKEIAEKLTGIPKRIPGCSITRLDTLSQLDDERMKRMLQGDEYDRRQYQERKQQYKGQKQRSAAQLTKA